MFKIGDEVVYPMHGAGIITAIEDKNIDNKARKYLVVQMVVGDMVIMVPADNVDKVGLRSIIKPAQVAEVEAALQDGSPSQELPMNWNRRSNLYMEQLRSGNIYTVSQVVRNLLKKEKIKKISTGERRILNTGKQILLSELALVCKQTYPHMQNWLEQVTSQL